MFNVPIAIGDCGSLLKGSSIVVAFYYGLVRHRNCRLNVLYVSYDKYMDGLIFATCRLRMDGEDVNLNVRDNFYTRCGEGFLGKLRTLTVDQNKFVCLCSNAQLGHGLVAVF